MGVVDNVKEVADLVKKLGDIELYRKIVSLEYEVLDLSRNNRELANLVDELKITLRFSSNIKFKAPFYWLEADDTPFCPKCWEADKKGIHMHLTNSENLYYECPVCQFGTTK